MRRAASDLGSDLQRNIGDKLKGVFTVSVIEEVVRRTGEWAASLSKTALELGMNTTELQALQLAARRAGVEQDKIFSFYNKIEAAAAKATKSQKAFNESFGKLGISRHDLVGPRALNTNELGAKVMAARGPESAFANIVGSRNLLQFQALQRVMGGKNPGEYAKENESQIVAPGQVSAMGTAWGHIIDDMTSIGNKLKPAVAILLNMVDGVLKMVNGLAGTVHRLFSFKNSFDEKVITLGATGRSVANFIPNTVSGIGSIFGIKGNSHWFNKNWMQTGKEAYGSALSDEAYREAEGAGEGLSTIASFGLGPAARAAGMGGEAIGGGLSAAGRLVGKEGLGAGLGQEGLFGTSARFLTKKAYAGYARMGGYNKFINEMGFYHDAKGIIRNKGTGLPMSAADKDALFQLITQKGILSPSLASQALRGLPMAGALASAGGVGTSDVNNNGMFPDTGRAAAPNRSNLSFGMGGGGSNAGSSNLSVGGTFGVDIQSKIMALDEKMVNLLEQLVVNTNPQYSGGAGDETGGSGL